MTARSDRHIDPARLLELEEARLGVLEREDVVRHLQSCGRCQAEQALVRQFLSVPRDARLEEGHSQRLAASFKQRLEARTRSRGSTRGRLVEWSQRKRPAGWSRRQWLASGLLAASLALMTVGGYQTFHHADSQEPGTRLRAAGDATKTFRVHVQPAPGGGWDLSWPSAAAPLRSDADSTVVYRVRVVTPRAETVLERRVRDLHLHLDSGALVGGLQAPFLLVVVEAEDAAGNVTRSEPTRLARP